MAEPWDRLPTESEEAYSRFLIYRNVGLNRTLKKAYLHFLRAYDEFTGSGKSLHTPGNWWADYKHFFWSERATAWDIRNLHNYGARLAVLHTQAVTKIAEKCVRLSSKLNPGDKGWGDLLDSVSVVQGYLSPEVVKGIADRNKSSEPAALPAHVGDDGVS